MSPALYDCFLHYYGPGIAFNAAVLPILSIQHCLYAAYGPSIAFYTAYRLTLTMSESKSDCFRCLKLTDENWKP